MADRFNPHSHMIKDGSGTYVPYVAYEALVERHRRLLNAVGQMHSQLTASGVNWEDASPSTPLPSALIKEAVGPVILEVVQTRLD